MNVIELVKLSTGDVGFFVNSQIITTADPDFESTSDVPVMAENLCVALGVTLVVIEMDPPPLDDWNWDDIAETLPSANGRTAADAQSQAASDTPR